MFIKRVNDLVANLKEEPKSERYAEWNANSTERLLRAFQSADSAGDRLTVTFDASLTLAMGRVVQGYVLSKGDPSVWERESTVAREAVTHLDEAAEAAMRGEGEDLREHLQKAVSILATPGKHSGELPAAVTVEITDSIDSVRETFADVDSRTYVQKWLAEKDEAYAERPSPAPMAASPGADQAKGRVGRIDTVRRYIDRVLPDWPPRKG